MKTERFDIKNQLTTFLESRFMQIPKHLRVGLMNRSSAINETILFRYINISLRPPDANEPERVQLLNSAGQRHARPSDSQLH